MKSIPAVSIGSSPSVSDPLSRQSAAALCNALGTIGFAYLLDHGVSLALIEDAFAASRDFHTSPQELKETLAINEFHRGYMGLATSTIVTSSVARVTKPNLSESLMIMHELAPNDPDRLLRKPLQGPNQWPGWLPRFQPTIEAYISALEKVARRLVRLIAIGLGMPEGALDSYFTKPTTFLRLLRYPPHPAGAADGQFGSAPHTDYGIMTILAQDRQAGLQVRPRNSDWIDAPSLSGSLVLNVGDMLERWTNGRFVSTPHRVVNRSTSDRYSIPYFFDTAMNEVIECLPTCTDAANPPRHVSVRYGDYLMDRLERNYAHRKSGAAIVPTVDSGSEVWKTKEPS
jgi:isopenicillin N synthase-like dioxygenase